MKISIFGLGYVGCTVAACLAKEGHDIIGVDINSQKIDMIRQGKIPFKEAGLEKIIKDMIKRRKLKATFNFKKAVKTTNISIICVATPVRKSGALNLDSVIKVAKEIGETIRHKKSFHTICIKSTVLPTTNRKVAKVIAEISSKKNNKDFCIISNPEFLREGHAVKDYYNAPFVVVGGECKKGINIVKKMHANLNIPIEIVAPEVAEMVKYVSNIYHALKISFANQISEICQKLETDSYEVMELFNKDKHSNISCRYLKPGFAYGGSCLPKDIEALLYSIKRANIHAPLLSSIKETNEKQKHKFTSLLIKLKKKKVGVIGLSFKYGTDDIRNSPIIDVMEKLIKKGFEFKVFDKHLILDRLIGTNREYLKSKNFILADLMTEDINDILKRSEIIVVHHKIQSLIPQLMHIPRNKIIVDLAYIKELRRKQNYIGINW